MRILVLTAKAIFPLHGGAEIRNFSLLKEASRHHEVYSLSFVNLGGEKEHELGVAPFCKRVEVITLPPRPRARRIANALGSWAGGARPLVLTEYQSAAMSRARAHVREEKIDVIHAHCLARASTEERGNAAFVYDAHNLSTRARLPACRSRSCAPSEGQIRNGNVTSAHWKVACSRRRRNEFLRVVPESDVATILTAPTWNFQPRPTYR
jgi:hypothetical protein